jgi:hypothetical protein
MGRPRKQSTPDPANPQPAEATATADQPAAAEAPFNPGRLEDFEEWRTERDKLRLLQQKLDQAVQRERGLHDRERALKEGRRKRALALIANPEDVDTDAQTVEAIRQDRARIAEETATLGEAVEIQTHNVEAIARKISQDVHLKALPEHKKIVVRIARAVASLCELNDQERQLRESLTDNGFGCLLQPSQFFATGDGREYDSAAAYFIRECQQAGYLPESDPAVHALEVMRGESPRPDNPARPVCEQPPATAPQSAREQVLARAQQVEEDLGDDL